MTVSASSLPTQPSLSDRFKGIFVPSSSPRRSVTCRKALYASLWERMEDNLVGGPIVSFTTNGFNAKAINEKGREKKYTDHTMRQTLTSEGGTNQAFFKLGFMQGLRAADVGLNPLQQAIKDDMEPVYNGKPRNLEWVG